METLTEASAEVNCNPHTFNSLDNAPATLTCHQCNAVSIPAPEGATADTRYICPQCSPLGPELEHFDRCQFDDAAFRETNFSSESMNALHELRNGWQSIIRRSRPQAVIARDRGSNWIMNANEINLSRLTERRRLALIMTAWGGMTCKQAAEVLGATPTQVRNAVREAKRKLAGFKDGQKYRKNTKVTPYMPSKE